MKKPLVYFVLFTFILIIGVTSVQTTGTVRGTITLDRNLSWPGPQTSTPDWIGFVNIDGVQYGMAFFHITTGKPFTNGAKGTARFFGEIWTIYDTINYQLNNGNLVSWTPGTILLNGTDSGVVTTSNTLYRMNGEINFVQGNFAMYLGYQVHMSGHIVFYPSGVPEAAPGVFQID